MRTVHLGVPGELDNLPGCSQIVVSHSVFVHAEDRGNGRGTKAHAARLADMKRLGYDYAMCTVDDANRAQGRIMREFGWKRLDSFVSTKTGHLVVIYGKALNAL